jgi:hypothetical protein
MMVAPSPEDLVDAGDELAGAVADQDRIVRS